MNFSLDSASRRRLGHRLIDAIDRYFTALPDLPVQLPLQQRSFAPLHNALPAHFPDAIEQGVATIGAQPLVYASAEAHHSLDKSAGLLGIGRRALRRVPVDQHLRLDPTQLEAAIARDQSAGARPFCVVAT